DHRSGVESAADALKRTARLPLTIISSGIALLSRPERMLPERGWWCKLAHMPPAKVGKLAPVTLGHMRSQGCRDLLVNSGSGGSDERRIINVGHLPDEIPIKSVGDGFVCAKCGHLGAEVVPNWPVHAAPRPA